MKNIELNLCHIFIFVLLPLVLAPSMIFDLRPVPGYAGDIVTATDPLSLPGVAIISASDDGMILRVDFPHFQYNRVRLQAGEYNVVSIPGTKYVNGSEMPSLPVYGMMLDIPGGMNVSASVVDSESTTVDEYDLPGIAFGRTPGSDNLPVFMNYSHRGSGNTAPADTVKIGVPGTVKDSRIVLLNVYPLQSDQARGKLKIHSSVTVKIDYSPAPARPFQETVRGYDYLIITDQRFKDAAGRLVDRRNASGLSSIVYTTDTTGSTNESIKAFIQDKYSRWAPRPSYLLLLGDVDTLPPFYINASDELVATDLYYSIMNGPEASPPYRQEYWTPDLAVGRIPVKTAAEADTVIQKIVEYEESQGNSGSRQAMIASYFQDNNGDGREDKPFIQTSEELSAHLASRGYRVERLYNATNQSINPLEYNNSIQLPPNLRRPYYPWNSSTPDIVNSFNDRRSVVIHRDHGLKYGRGWSYPRFTTNNVSGLSNSGELPIVFSIDCWSGTFDNQSQDCLSEALLKKATGGAAGVIGSSGESVTGENDDLVKGFVDAVWPEFDTGSGSPVPVLRMGDVLNSGKKYMLAGRSAESPVILKEFAEFHYFGDPAMEIKP